MKKLILTVLLIQGMQLYAQTELYKNNLFESKNESVVVTKKADYYVIAFNSSGKEHKDSIYSWNYDLVIDVFLKYYKTDDKNVVKEAAKVFYGTKISSANEIQNSQLLAGRMGFENKIVILRKDYRIHKTYKRHLKQAIKHFKNNSKDTVQNKNLISYKQFVVKNDKPFSYVFKPKFQIRDTLLGDAFYSKRYLKEHGYIVHENYVNTKIEKEYFVALDSIKILFDKSKIIKDDTVKMNKLIEEKKQHIQSLEKYTYDVNIKTESIYKQIQKIEKDINKNEIEYLRYLLGIASPIAQIHDSILVGKYLPLQKYKHLEELKKIERELIEKQLSTIFINNDNRNILSSFDTLKVIYHKELSNISSGIDIKKIELKKISESLSKLTTGLESVKKNTIKPYEFELLPISIDSIQIDISKTLIERVIVHGQVLNFDNQENNKSLYSQKYVEIYNKAPIGISTIKNIEKGNNEVELFAYVNNGMYKIPLREVIAFYRPKLVSNRTDLSPADTAFTVSKNNELQTVILQKEKTEKLFELKVFTDIVGFDETNSNGLVQTKLEKKIYLNPNRHYFENSWHSVNYGSLTYINPNFSLSKIESNNKYYLNNKKEISSLTLKEYEILNVGFDLNVFLLSIPAIKGSLYFDPGFYFGKTGYSFNEIQNVDSSQVLVKNMINTFTPKFSIVYLLQADERYFFETVLSYQYYHLADKNIKQISDINKGCSKILYNNPIYGLEFFAGFKIRDNDESRIFGRYRYNYSLSEKHSFSQVQIGYSHYITKK
jgi:hypothetical protein